MSLKGKYLNLNLYSSKLKLIFILKQNNYKKI